MSEFEKNYFRYFLWNEGLINHFFSKGKHEIYLHVDKKLFEEIGTSLGIHAQDHVLHFSSAVENFCNNYNRYICPKGSPNSTNVCGHDKCKYYQSRVYCLKEDRRNDILAVANHICSKEIKYYARFEEKIGQRNISIKRGEDGKAIVHNIPFFAIVIYLLLKFDNGETQQWDNVEGIAGKSRTFIPSIWNALYKYDKRFDPNASCRKPNDPQRGDYVGKILYHLPLSTPTRKKIHDAIYKSGAWKFFDSKSFLEIICMIQSSLNQNTLNEINEILLNDYKGISVRILQDVIDSFDIEEYKQKIDERSAEGDYVQTISSGKFALGIYFPDDEFTENSIVLLTTIQHEIEDGDFHILEGSSGSLAGYNTNFVEYRHTTNVNISKYSLRSAQHRITHLAYDDVIFFYKYDESLYIQTRDTNPTSEYIVAVKKGSEHNFEEWCNQNCNTFEKFTPEDTHELFGSNWTIYACEQINGRYYAKISEIDDTHITSSVVMKGGIKNSAGIYFINSLPYFELPASYDISKLKLYINLNGTSWNDYCTKVIGRKFIIDITDMPIYCEDIVNLSICFVYDNDENARFYFDVNACGQAVHYNHVNFYKFDKFGKITEDTTNYSYQGSDINNKYRCENISQFPSKKFADLDSVTEDFYFVNLLAACCYDNPTSEITESKLEKCVSYAATRLNVDIQQKHFISIVKQVLKKADIARTNGRKCQAVAPSFMMAPYSSNGVRGNQYHILSGCYTRSFIADLIKYCKDKHVSISYQRYNSSFDAEKFLPPLVLVGHNFKPLDFKEVFKHQFEILTDHDYAASLLNITPELTEAVSEFEFNNNDAPTFINSLKPALVNDFPRLRVNKRENHLKAWYIEYTEHQFAEVKKHMIPWASLFCHIEKQMPMIIQHDRSVMLPKSLILPDYIDRALYMMNLGLPKTLKAFITGMNDDKYFTLVNSYNLHSSERVGKLVSKLTGADQSSLAKHKVQTAYKMEYWKEDFKGKKYKEAYLLITDKDSGSKQNDNQALTDYNKILAAVHRNSIYIYCRGTLRKVQSNVSINETITYILMENWKFDRDGTSIGISKDYGQTFEPKYTVSNEILELPNFSKFKKDDIKIL